MTRELRIEDKTIGCGPECYAIAEIGQNHQGDVKIALELFRVAKECGVDAVKLQKRDNRSLYAKRLYDMPYDNENSFGPTYGAHREALEFGKGEYVELQQYARELGLAFFATAWDFKSADFLADLDVPAYKIASGDLRSIPLLKHVAQIGKPMIVSTGGGSLDDVRRAHDAIMPINPQLCLLQCTAAYPAEAEHLNLRVIDTYQKTFPGVIIGLSDHENGIAMAVAAYVLGARVFEKHFTLNHTWKGTDHVFSLEPIGMRKFVRDLRRVPKAMGDGIKQALPCEQKPLAKMSKSIVAARDLPAGHILSKLDVAFKSPGGGLAPFEVDKILGRKLREALREDDLVAVEHLM